MNELMYEMIYKRKSFHIFKDIGVIEKHELEEIKEVYKTFVSLHEDIKTEIRIVENNEVTCKRGQEYCILIYSEKKEGYLQNVGYIGEQLDLYLASKNIGALWFGIGKVTQPQYNGLDFVIMLAIAKMPEDKFRKNMFKSKRKTVEEIWEGKQYLDIANIVRFTPSACNSQPWFVKELSDKLEVYRYKKEGKRGIMPKDKVSYYNQIDTGIFMLFLELCFTHHKIEYKRTLLDDAGKDVEYTLIAIYSIKKDTAY